MYCAEQVDSITKMKLLILKEGFGKFTKMATNERGQRGYHVICTITASSGQFSVELCVMIMLHHFDCLTGI